MKNGWKVFWIACICTAGVGLGLFLIGIVTGANWGMFKQTYEANIKENEITIQNHQWDEDSEDDFYEDDFEVDEDDEVDNDSAAKDGTALGNQVSSYENIKQLKVDITACEVQIKTTTDKTVMVDASNVSEKLNLQTHQSGGSLELISDNNIPGNKTCGTLIISLPKEYELEEAELTIGAGRMLVEAINAKQLDIEVGAGEAIINGSTFYKLDAECGAGQLTVEATGAYRDYNYDVECGIGVVNIGEHKYSGLAVEQMIDNNAKKDIQIECGLGQMNLTFQK